MKKNELTRVPKDVTLQAIQVAMLKSSEDVTDATYTPKGNLIRICAIEDSRIKISDTDAGVFLPKNTIEYFGVIPGIAITITGSVNIMGGV